MSSRKAIAPVIGLIIVMIVAFSALMVGSNVLSTMTIPSIKKISLLGNETTTEPKLLKGNYYDISFTPASVRGSLEIIVKDPEENFVTDFHHIIGYELSEDSVLITKPIQVQAHHNLYVSMAVDAGMEEHCESVLDALKNLKFANTFVGFFPDRGEVPLFKHLDAVTSCADTGGDYWKAVNESAASLPAGDENYRMVFIVSDGACPEDIPNCKDQDQISSALQALGREDIDEIHILTSDIAGCEAEGNIRTTSNTIPEGKGGCYGLESAVGVLRIAQDSVPPAKITDLTAVGSSTENSITLSWSAPGDDGATGTASGYDLRYLASQITSENWNSIPSSQRITPPVPRPAGQRETYTVTGLNSGTTYYFAIAAADEAGNWAPISDSATGTTPLLSLSLSASSGTARQNEEITITVTASAQFTSFSCDNPYPMSCTFTPQPCQIQGTSCQSSLKISIDTAPIGLKDLIIKGTGNGQTNYVVYYLTVIA